MSKQKYKASALVITLSVLGLILMASLSLALVSVQERKGSIGASKSTAAFQIADSGVESVLQAIKKNSAGKVRDLVDGISGANCSDGVIAYGTNDNGYRLELFAGNNPVSCSDNSAFVASVSSIKSTGTYNGEQRFIEAAVAGTNLSCKVCNGNNTASTGCKGNEYNTSTGMPLASNADAGMPTACFMNNAWYTWAMVYAWGGQWKLQNQPGAFLGAAGPNCDKVMVCSN